jgi:hypothetical protein
MVDREGFEPSYPREQIYSLPALTTHPPVRLLLLLNFGGNGKIRTYGRDCSLRWISNPVP